MRPKRSMGSTYFLKRGPYFLFMMREVTSFFIGAWAVLLLLLLAKLLDGPQAYDEFIKVLGSTPLLAFQGVAFLFALLHTITFFNAAPKGMVVWRGEEKLPPAAIVAPNYLAFLAFSAALVYLVLVRPQV